MKHYFFTLLTVVLFSCSKEEPEKPNTPPQAFEVTAKVDGADVILTWTEALDEDGDVVTYAVVYSVDTLVKGLTASTFTIKDLPYETEISGTVVASDGRGGVTEKAFNLKTGTEPWDDRYVKIPDAEFEKYLIHEGIDDVLDGKLLRNNALKVKELKRRVTFSEQAVMNFSGIEAFENLEAFEWLGGYGNLGSPIISFKGLSKLKEVNISFEYSSGKFDFSDNPLLETLISKVEGYEIDISKNLNLKTLEYGGKVVNSMINNNLKLKQVILFGKNEATLMDLSKHGDLEHLTFDANLLDKVDLLNNVKLKKLHVFNSSYSRRNKELVLPKTATLESLTLSTITLSKIDLSNYTDLEIVEISYCDLNSINLKSLTKLTHLNLNSNSLEAVDLSTNSELVFVYLSNNALTELNLCKNAKIHNLTIDGNKLMVVYIHPSVVFWLQNSSIPYKVCS